MATLYVLIPALDEAANVRRLFADLGATRAALVSHGLALRVVLVDDGSTDGTADVARSEAAELDLTVARHPSPQGPGRAFATGFQVIEPELEDDDYVLTLEADNTSRIDLLELMLIRSREGHDAVFASPYAYGGDIVGTTRLRTALSHVANSFVKGALDIRGLLTVSSFYRLQRGSAIRRLQLHYGPRVVERAGFESMVEIVLKMTYLRMSISEVPMVLDSTRRVGKSKMRVVRTGVGYLALFRHKRRWRAIADAPLAQSPVGEAPVGEAPVGDRVSSAPELVRL
jgi:glycosyltransferase involved in cell wall biosynthesis